VIRTNQRAKLSDHKEDAGQEEFKVASELLLHGAKRYCGSLEKRRKPMLNYTRNCPHW
jgi:hypothetical protein